MKLINVRKIFLVACIILLPMVSVVVIFTPLINQKATKREYLQYELPQRVTHDDVKNFINLMSKDPEFHFYFMVIPKGVIDDITAEVFHVVSNYPTKEALLNELTERQQKVRSLAIFFLNLDYSEEFIKAPRDFEQLRKVLVGFFSEEFKLTILGGVYKTGYQPNFSFDWDKESKEAALKLSQILTKMTEQNRVILWDSNKPLDSNTAQLTEDQSYQEANSSENPLGLFENVIRSK